MIHGPIESPPNRGQNEVDVFNIRTVHIIGTNMKCSFAIRIKIAKMGICGPIYSTASCHIVKTV